MKESVVVESELKPPRHSRSLMKEDWQQREIEVAQDRIVEVL